MRVYGLLGHFLRLRRFARIGVDSESRGRHRRRRGEDVGCGIETRAVDGGGGCVCGSGGNCGRDNGAVGSGGENVCSGDGNRGNGAGLNDDGANVDVLKPTCCIRVARTP